MRIMRKNYLLGLFVVVAVSVSFMATFVTKSITLQEGWYSIYARYIIEDGLIPYKDFNLIVPPLGLYIWVAIQYIFGDNFIVFHIADVFAKTIMGVLFFHLLTKLFPIWASAISTVVFQAISISIIFDNGVISYNTYWVIMMFVMALLMIAQLDFMKTHGRPSHKHFILLGLSYTVIFLIKQTSGPLTILGSVSLMLLAVYKQNDAKMAIQSLCIMFLSSMALLAVPASYFIYHDALVPYINNVFLSFGAKGGSIADVFKKIPDMIFIYQQIVSAFVFMVICFAAYVYNTEKNIRFKINKVENRTTTILIASLGIFLCVMIFSYIYIKDIISPLRNISNNFNKHKDQFVLMGFFFTFFTVIYFTIKSCIEKSLNHENFKLLSVAGLFLAGTLSILLSAAYPNIYPYVLGFAMALCLSYDTKFKLIKNLTISTSAVLICFWCISMKVQTPAIFHGWKCGSLTSTFVYSDIPKLKGMTLPIDEVAAYEDIYYKTQRYTAKDDPILAFLNNQVFYDLLERKPYVPYISLYHDVSPDEQSIDTAIRISENPPKAIVYFAWSIDTYYLHEHLFRQSKVSGQRILNDYIMSLIHSNDYIVVSRYKNKTYIDKTKFNDNDNITLKRIQYLERKTERMYRKMAIDGYDPIIQYGIIENQEILKKMRRRFNKYKTVNNSFLIEGNELMLLIRKDVYYETNKLDPEDRSTWLSHSIHL